ncbi:hypothetical protein [Dietzia natronolimnaea]|uniref:hypothetical protein n=1 Tax=Dietzia natronolimnaea TaxID=161920 RepID=UPI001140E6A2|nr:hypothetical protein [Dietzia natronolimnaea]
MAIPTAEVTSTSGNRDVPLSYRYQLDLRYTYHEEFSHAWAQLAIRVETTSLFGGDRWSVNAILARAECGNSRQLPNIPNRPTENNPAVTSGAASPMAAQAMTAEDALEDASTDGDGTDDPTASMSEHTQLETGDGPYPSDPSDKSESSSTPATPARRTTTATMTPTSAPSTSTKQTTIAQTTTAQQESQTIVIPSAPGTLSASAQTTTVGTVEVDGEDLDVVVKGGAVPPDAPTALPALGTWINEGTRPSGDWRTFTSSDPDSDGWRRAAINRETGTVVYVR